MIARIGALSAMIAGLLSMTASGCAKSDCVRAREALGSVATEIEAAPLEGSSLRDGAFAQRLREEIDAIDIDDPGLQSSLTSFTETMQQLAATRQKRDQVALQRAEREDELSRIRRKLSQAHVGLGHLCDGTLEHCMMKGEVARVTSAFTNEHAGGQLPKQVTRIRKLVRASTMKMERLADAERTLEALDEEIEELEAKAAGHGLEVGGHCSTG